MTIRNKYVPGDWLVVCDRCGFKIYYSQSRKTWDNLIVCKECWEPKHPQYNEPRGKGERQTVPVHRPDPPVVYGSGSVDDL